MPAASANAQATAATPNGEKTATTQPPEQNLRVTTATTTTTAKPTTPPTNTPHPAHRAHAQASTPTPPTAWTLQLDRIVAEQVQSVSLRQLHIEGQGQLQLGLFKQLRGVPMELFPSRAVFESARVRWGRTK